jgi:peptidoglycan/xylan/chitin deacetylase (PgdA/CDA1 family)
VYTKYLASLLLVLALVGGRPVLADEHIDSIEFDGTLRRIYVPVLMYHYVSELPEDADEYRQDLTVTPETFYAHMSYLRDEGYTTISLYQLHEALLTGSELPPRPIVLTFDDGHIDHYVTVLPILQEFGFTGTFFIITGLADAGHPDYVNWGQIQAMADAGMDMESHTKTHRDLRERDVDFLVYEIVGSIESMEAHLDRSTRLFAYPAGRYDDLTLAVLGSTPVVRAVTTRFGAHHTTDNRLELPRLRVSGDMGVAGLAHLLNSSR